MQQANQYPGKCPWAKWNCFLLSSWKTIQKSHAWTDDRGLVLWVSIYITTEGVGGGCCSPVLFALLSPTTGKCWCMVWRTSWWFIQADAASLRHGEGGAGIPPISTAWGRCAPKYLIQMCPLDYATSLHPDASVMYVVHLASETEMRTILPFEWQLMHSMRTIIRIFKYFAWLHHRQPELPSEFLVCFICHGHGPSAALQAAFQQISQTAG